MRKNLFRLVIPAYLLLCLVLGGSSQGIWANMALQLVAVAIIAWAALARKREPLTGASKLLLLLAILGLVLLLLQLVPLPAGIWGALPGRELIEEGFSSLGYSPGFLALSVAPYQTLATALTLLPPLAVLVGIVRLKAYREGWLAGALLAGTFLAVLLGVIQTVNGQGQQSWWYLYEITNIGSVGFFANRNHMGTLLLVSIPFAVAVFAGGNRKGDRHGQSQALLAIGATGLLIVLVGLALNGSLAALALAVPTIAFSALILPGRKRWPVLAVPLAALATVAAVLLYTNGPVQSKLAGSDITSFESRWQIWKLTAPPIADSFPAGTGIGTFEHVYRLLEDPAAITRKYVNHAHNDYLELVLEAGAAGLLLILAFILWWVRQTAAVWRSALNSHFARAATIASGVILAHSIVDYPLRTAAMAAVFAASLAIMAQPWRQRSEEGESTAARPAKHLVIG